jgi:hypothetical protein
MVPGRNELTGATEESLYQPCEAAMFVHEHVQSWKANSLRIAPFEFHLLCRSTSPSHPCGIPAGCHKAGRIWTGRRIAGDAGGRVSFVVDIV